MSLWYNAKYGDENVDFENKTVDFLVKSTNQGNEYLSISFKQFLEIATLIEVKSNEKPNNQHTK